METRLPEVALTFRPSVQETITYQDPCRLGRFSGNYEKPRQLLELIPDIHLVEMEQNRENALCCGTSAWMECSNCSKATRTERLQEALATGARTLITACPKCQIHFTCAQRSAELDLEVIDIYAYFLKQLGEDKA